MSTEIRWRRGTAAQTNAFTGAPAEVTVDTTRNQLVVHDGVTPGGFRTLMASVLVSVKDFGAVGDGATDDTVAIQAALNSNPGSLFVPPGTYVVSPLTVPASVSLWGAGDSSILDFTATGSTDPFLSATGVLGSAKVTTEPINRYATSLAATAHGLAVGDWFRIISTVDANSAAAGDDRLGDRADVVYLTETHQVHAVADADNFSIRGMFRFTYPTGSAVKKLSGLKDIALRGFKIKCGSKVNKPLQFSLGGNIKFTGLTLDNPGAPSQMRGCYDGSLMDGIRAYGDAATALATNLILLQATDGCTGVRITNFDLANGGQLLDITYTPSLTTTIAAPNVDTYVGQGVCRNASFSAITDHPGSDGTTVVDSVMHNVAGAVYIRSRNATVDNIKAWGRNDGATKIGIYGGESGFWRSLRVSNCQMFGFAEGYRLAGSGSSITYRDASFINNASTRCNVGEYYGTFDGVHCGINSLGSQHTLCTDTGIYVNGQMSGISLKNFKIRGALTNAAIEISGSLANADIDGEVIDIGVGIPALRVSSGAPYNNRVAIKRTGNCGLNVGVTKSMVQITKTQVAQGSGYPTHTGVTGDTVLATFPQVIPPGTFNETAYLKVTVRGVIVGTAGTKAIKFGTNGLGTLLGFVSLPSTATSNFIVEFLMVGTGAASQTIYQNVMSDGVVSADPSNVTRTLNAVNGSGIAVAVGLGNAADSVTIGSIEVESIWV